MRRCLAGLAAGVLLASILAACGGGGHSSTELRVHLFRADSGTANYTLSCNPDGGTVKNPAGVCAVVQRTPGLLRFHPGIDHPCPCCPAAVRVTGTAARHQVAVTFAPCETGQEEWARRWTRLVGYTEGERIGPGAHQCLGMSHDFGARC
jgi:hypothetical protein